MGWRDRRQDRRTLLGIAAATPLSAQGGLPGDFGQGLQYSIPFQTDDAYADWSPTRPQAYFSNPYYPQMTPTSGPIFNTLMRDADDFDDRFDGLASSQKRKLVRKLKGMP